MPTYTQQDYRDEVRSRTKDDASAPYATDSQIDSFIQAGSIDVSRYVGVEVLDITTAGDGTTEYSIPATVDTDAVLAIGVIDGTDTSTFRPFPAYQMFAGNVVVPYSIPSSQKVAFKYERPIVATDNITSRRFEAIILAACIKWCEFAAAHRTDFEQWAATQRSDTRISEIAEFRRMLKTNLTEVLSSLGPTTIVVNT